jgi:hypothetical protein
MLGQILSITGQAQSVNSPELRHFMFLAMYSRDDGVQAFVTQVAGSCLGAQFKPRGHADLNSMQYGSRDLSSGSETVFECTPVRAKLVEGDVAVKYGAACSA